MPKFRINDLIQRDDGDSNIWKVTSANDSLEDYRLLLVGGKYLSTNPNYTTSMSYYYAHGNFNIVGYRANIKRHPLTDIFK